MENSDKLVESSSTQKNASLLHEDKNLNEGGTEEVKALAPTPSHHLASHNHPIIHRLTNVTTQPSISNTIDSNTQTIKTPPTHTNPTTPQSQTYVEETIQGTYGQLHVDKNGNYQFTLAAKSPAYLLLQKQEPGTDTFTVHLTDGTKVIIQVPVMGKQDSPTITGQLSGHLEEDHNVDSHGFLTTSGKVDVLDPDHGESELTPETIHGQFGSLSINSQGYWQYTVNNSQSTIQALTNNTSLTETFTIHTKDGTPQVLQMSIGGENDNALVSGNDKGQVYEDLSTHITGKLSIRDADTGEDHFSNTDIVGSLGTLHLTNSGQWTYDLDNTNPAVQALGKGSTVTDTITVHSVDGTPHQVIITINGTNDAATVSSATVAVDETDKAITTSGTLTSTDVDNPDNTFTPDSITGTHGDLTIDANGHWVFTANSAFNQLNVSDKVEETFTVTSVDGTPSTIKVTINGTNDAATVSSATVAGDETDKAITTSGTLTSTDIDNPDNTFTPDSITGTHGDLTIDANGHWVFTANSAFNQLNVGDKVEETFTVMSVDGTPSTIKVTINGTNDAATVSSATAAVDETDKAVTTSGTLTSTDIDNPDNTFTPDSITGTHGDLTINANGHWVFTANSAFNQLNVGDKVEETFTVTSVDGTPSTIKVTINGTNDAATVSSATVAVDETDKAVTTFGTLTSTDVDNQDNAFTASTQHGTHGDLTIDGNGHWVFTANSEFNQLNVGDKVEETFTVTSVDSTPSTIKVTINGTNDAATVSSATVVVDETDTAITTSGTLTSTDVDNPDNAFTPASIAGNHGDLTIDSNGHWVFTANSAFNQLNVGDKVDETFTVASVDGTQSTIKVTINGTNDRPTISGTSSGAVIEQGLNTAGTPDATGSLTATDLDKSDTVTWAINQPQGQWGTLSIDQNGHWHYQLDNSTGGAADKLAAGEHQSESFWITATDSTGATVPHKVVIDVQGSNDKPIVSAWTQLPAGKEDQPVTIKASDLLTHASDVDSNDVLHVTNLQATHGSLTDNKDGTYTFTPDKDFNGEIRLTYDVVDGHGGSVSTQAKFDLTAAPDNAIITDAQTNADLRGVTEDRGYIDTHYQLHYDGKLNIQDPDAGEAQFDPNIGPQTYQGIGYDTKLGGHILLMRDGHYTYTLDNRNIQNLAQGEVKHDSAVIRSADGTTHTIELTVYGTNDAPTINAQSHSVTEGGSVLNGQMVGQDIDTGAALTYSAPQIDGLVVNPDGSYSFNPAHSSYQSLASGVTKTLTVPVTVTDEHNASSTQNLSITITGVNNSAVIGGVDTGDVTEGNAGQDMSPDYAQPGMAHLVRSTIRTSGKISISDTDTGEAEFDTHGLGFNYSGQYGDLLLRKDGTWFYHADTGQIRSTGGLASTRGTTIDQLGENQTLTDTITVYSKDGTSHDIVITIHGSNDRPYCASEVQLNSGKEDLTQTITATELIANTVDVDANDAGKLTIANLHADHGSIQDNHDGTFTFTPTKDYNGQVHFTYDVTDAHGGITATGANLHLQATGDAATITGIDQGNVTEDRGYIDTQYNLHFDGKLDIVDPDQGEAQFDIQRGHTYHGIGYDTKMGGWVLLQQDGTYTYTIDNHKPEIQNLGSTETLVDKVTIHSVDGTSHEIQITIHGTNDDPKVSSVTTLPAGTEDTDVVLHASDLLANATDIDHNDAGQLSVANLTADHGKITDNHDGTFTFHPALDYNGKVSFSYDVKDAHAGSTATSASMTLAPTSDAAVITGSGSGVKEDINVDISSGHLLGASGVFHVVDPDGPAQSQFPDVLYGGIYQGSHGGDLQVNSNGNYYYHISNYLVQHLSEGETLKEEYTIHSVDGTQHKVEFTVEGTNDKPVLSAQSQSVTEGGTLLSGQMHATDVDTKDTHTFTIDKPVDGLIFNNDGSYTFDPSHVSYQNLGANNDQVIHVQVKVDDHNGGTDTKTLTLVVHGANDGATIGGQDTFTVQEDHNLTLNSGNTIIYNGQLTITDADAGEDHFDGNLHQNQQTGTWDTGYTTQEGGKLILQSNGSYRYEIDNSLAKIQSLGSSETLIDTVTVRSADGTPHQIQVTIQGDNDAPVVSSAVTLTAGTEDIDVVLHASDLLANATDIDHNDAGKLSLANLIADHGKITDNHDGTFTFHPNQDYNGKVSFTYDVQDAHGGSVATSASITLTPTRDSAVIFGNDAGTIIEDHNVGHSSAQPVAASGLLSVTDPDARQDHFQVNRFGEQAIHDPFGGFLRITPSGAWGYEVANSHLQSLAEGEVEKVVYRVYSADHTAHDITITVTGTNDQPTITATTLAHGTEDTHYQMQASQFGFTDIDTGDTLHSIAITDLPPSTQGKFLLDGHDVTAGQHITTADISKLQFVPAQDFNGDVQFKYTVNDGHDDSQEATNTLHIDAIGDKAVITGVDTGDVHEGHTFTAPDGSMTGGYVDDRSPDHMHGNIGKLWNDEIHTDGHLSIVDADAGESYAQTGVYYGSHGRVILQTNGDWSYFASIGQDVTGRAIDHLGKGESLTDTVTVKSADGTTHDIIITIHGDNDRPYCSGEVQLNSGKEDLAQTITTTELLANTVDVDTNDAGQLTIANLHADHGTLVDNKDGTFTFTPNHNFNGKVHFTYDVKDAHGGVTHTGASATLLPSNDAATLQPTLASNFVTEDHLKSGTNTNELWSGWKNLDIQDIDSQPEAKVTQIEVNGVKHTVPANFAMNLAGTHGTFNFTHSTDGHDKWSYSADNSHAEVQSLSHGDSLTDTITLITADGTRIPLTAKILGTDDHVIIDTPDALTAALGTAIEDKVTSISGTLLAHDSDSKGSVTFTAGNSVGSYGTLHVDSNGQWHYDLDHSKANALQQGETKAEGFDITAISTDGSTATKHIEVLVQGNDDGAIISGQDSGQVTEDKHLQTSGNLTVTDPDSGEGHFTATSGSTQLGTYTIDASGHWTYSLDPRVQSLHQGETRPDVFTVHSADGTAHVIKVTITGTQDAPIITGQSTGAVYEDSQTSVFGTLNADDKDYGQSGFWAQSHIASTHNLGELSIDQNGYWTFHLDSTNPTVNSLGEHDTLQETVTVNTIDDTSKVIQITIHGTNDDPVLSVTQTTPTTGTLTETDVDVNDTHTFSVVNSTGQFGSLSVDPDSGTYVYTANGSVAGMSYNAATHTYHGTDVFEVKVADNHGGESSKFITFDANGHVSVVPGQSPTISTSVPSNPLVTTTQPSLPTGTNTPPNNAVTVDLAASSDTGTSDTDNLTKDSTPTITGHTDIPYSQVTIYDGSTPIGHAVSDGSGQYSVAVSSLSNGDHNLSAKALAPSSVLPATSSILSLHVDTVVAPLQISLTHDTGSNSSDLITSDGSLTINGQEAGATVEYSTDNGHTWTSSFTPQQGSNTVSVRQTDTAGNVSAETSVSFTLDNTVNAPTVSLSNDTGRHSINTPDLITKDSRLSIQTEAGAKVEYSNDGGHTWTAVFNPVEGVNDLQVRQTDIAGNVSPVTHFSFTLDTTPGTITVNPISQDNALNAAENNQPLVITGTTSNIAPGDVVYVVIGNKHFYDATVKPDGTWSLTLGTSIHQNIMATDRDYSIQVGTVDTAGNSTPRISTHLLVDTQSPIPHIAVDSVTQDNVLNALESGQTIAITGTVTGDYQTGDIVSLKINGATISSLTGSVDSSGHFSIPVAGNILEHANIHTSYANGQSGSIHSIEATIITTDAVGNVGSATTGSQVFSVDNHVSLPTITFENPGPDGLYSKAEIAHGHPNTVTATITPPGDAKVGEHLVVNGQDHVLDAHTLQHGIQIEVHPGSNVQATMTDEHGNTAGSQGFAASAIPEPIIVRPPSGSHQVSGTLGVPPLAPSQTPVPSAQNGWRIHLPNGQYVTSHHGQYGTLTIDPQTGHLHYQEQAQVHTGPHGSASGIGQHEDKFEIALQGTNQDEVVAHVNVQILSHGPGHSGKLTVGTEVVDMTITPIVHASHPAPPPPPPVQHDEPEVASHEDFTFTVSEDTSLDLSQHAHQESDQKTDHHGAAAYLDALGIQPNASPTTGHDQPADMDIVLAQVDQQHAVGYDQAHLDMSDALEHHDAANNHNQDDEHHHHNDVDGLPDIDPNN
ncbi:VCBS domain-containing protein [Vibrio sp. 10N.222.52.B12]|uniref:VCBS domain-containing protein n=1 Tax=Vibrio sp. 10N.222.52.B12 TaxID=1880840 RepID=UPI001F53B2AE|nr:VCBS domain-containing protein [Vibrio sp. 10N.222.52.B12]